MSLRESFHQATGGVSDVCKQHPVFSFRQGLLRYRNYRIACFRRSFEHEALIRLRLDIREFVEMVPARTCQMTNSIFKSCMHVYIHIFHTFSVCCTLYTHKHTYIYIYIHTFRYIYIHTHTFVNMYTYIRAHVCMRHGLDNYRMGCKYQVQPCKLD